MSVCLRQWTKEDLSTIAAMEKAYFSDAWTEGMLEEEFSRQGFCGWLVEDGALLLGYVCGVRVFEDADLFRIAVLQANRKTGLGEKLLLAFFKDLKEQGAERVFLEVRVDNTPACNLYKKHGFTPVRIREKYYGGETDAVEMRKELS